MIDIDKFLAILHKIPPGIYRYRGRIKKLLDRENLEMSELDLYVILNAKTVTTRITKR
jgi:hypothetical protein